MTPRLARVALGGFLLLAAGVTANALYLQGAAERLASKPPPPPRAEPRRQPSPTKAGKPPAAAEPPAVRLSAKDAQSPKVRTVRVATVSAAPQDAGDAETVRAVQAELNRLGYGPIAADGVMRPASRAAIMAFEQDQRLALTGEASQDLLKQLLFGAPVPAPASGSVEVRSAHARAVIEEVQRRLASRGYHPGAIDGRLSADTIAAIRTFEADQGLVPRGRISAAILERLERPQSGMAAGGRHRVR